MTDAKVEMVRKLGDVLDIIAAAEMEFAKTPEHHTYYGERHAAVNEAITALEQSDAVMGEADERVNVATREGAHRLAVLLLGGTPALPRSATFLQDPRIHAMDGECVCGAKSCPQCGPIAPVQDEPILTADEEAELVARIDANPNLQPVQDDDAELIEALTNIAKAMRYGPDQAWIEQAIDRLSRQAGG